MTAAYFKEQNKAKFNNTGCSWIGKTGYDITEYVVY